jgi:hypothetical protein
MDKRTRQQKVLKDNQADNRRIDMTEEVNIEENCVLIKLIVSEQGSLNVGFGWNIPDRESEEGDFLYLCGMGLLWMLHHNIDGLAKLGYVYEASRDDPEEDETTEAEIIPFPDKNLH